MQTVDTTIPDPNLDAQLDEDAFRLYTGLSVQEAKDLCTEEGIDFISEFQQAFDDYLTSLHTPSVS